MRSTTVFLAIVLAIVSCILAFHYSKASNEAVTDLRKERYMRFTVEEQLDTANSRVSSLEIELSRVQNKFTGIQKLLDQTAATNNDLKSRLDKASKDKEGLEAKIKKLEGVTSRKSPISTAGDT